jgi:predicted DCC family thiol-disulfide oxidoreductase YuxK
LPSNVFNSIVYISENRYLLNSSAILHVCKDLEGMWKYIYILIVIPAWLRDFIYNSIAKTRYKLFGKLDVCMVPGPEIAHRFL